MAKKAKASRKSRSSEHTTQTRSKMVLRVKSSETTKRVVCQEETTLGSLKKANTRQQKIKKKKQIKNFDANKPKKPPTAFFFFLEDFRKEFKEQNPEVKAMRDIGKACGEKWKTMAYEEKVQYYDIATEKRAAFDTAIAEYTRRKESGEDEETQDNSDFDVELAV